MSSKKSEKPGIRFLQDITMKYSDNVPHVLVSTGPHKCDHLPHQSDNCDDDTVVNVEYNSRRASPTASINSFGEEPVFSDSEEENEYDKNILEDQQVSLTVRMTPAKMNVEIQCDLTTNKDEILDIIKRCANINAEDINEDFKELVSLCRRLEYKYQYETPPESSYQGERVPSTSQHHEHTCSEQSQSNVSPNLLPSRQGSDDFVSESFSLGSQLNLTSIVENLSADHTNDSTRSERNNKSKTVRRSARLKRSSAGSNNRKTANEEPSTSRKIVKNRKRVRQKNIEELVRNFMLTNKGSSNNKVVTKKPCLPKQMITSLARNWMKPNNSLISTLRNRSFRRRVRRLYSANNWKLSKEFSDLSQS